MDISIIILNWNGLGFLKECVPSVIRACRNYGDNCEIMVVDNGSRDGSRDYLKLEFPFVRIAALERNFGFAKAMNIGIKEAAHSLVVCLNNDVVVDKNFILPLARYFNDGSVFAVAAKMFLWDRKTLYFGRTNLNFRWGFMHRVIWDSAVSAYTLYACAGGFAVDKNKFLKIGGFDEDMDVYWEDLDLCYRAWKQGYKTIYEPQSMIYHKFHGTNLQKYGRRGIDRLSGRNYTLFVLKNIHDRKLLSCHLFFLPVLMFASALAGRSRFAAGILSSFKIWPIFLKKREAERKKAIFSDREVLNMSSK